jgi:hypothetical protein
LIVLAVWHSAPTPYQVIEHVKFIYLRWLSVRLVRAHWVR